MTTKTTTPVEPVIVQTDAVPRTSSVDNRGTDHNDGTTSSAACARPLSSTPIGPQTSTAANLETEQGAPSTANRTETAQPLNEYSGSSSPSSCASASPLGSPVELLRPEQTTPATAATSATPPSSKLALVPLHPGAWGKKQKFEIIKPLPIVLGRTNLANWWWRSCPCQHYCRLHCRPVAQNIKSLSKVMIQLDTLGRVHIAGKNPQLVTVTPERGNLPLECNDIVSVGRRDREPWMRFQVIRYYGKQSKQQYRLQPASFHHASASHQQQRKAKSESASRHHSNSSKNRSSSKKKTNGNTAAAAAAVSADRSSKKNSMDPPEWITTTRKRKSSSSTTPALTESGASPCPNTKPEETALQANSNSQNFNQNLCANNYYTSIGNKNDSEMDNVPARKRRRRADKTPPHNKSSNHDAKQRLSRDRSNGVGIDSQEIPLQHRSRFPVETTNGSNNLHDPTTLTCKSSKSRHAGISSPGTPVPLAAAAQAAQAARADKWDHHPQVHLLFQDYETSAALVKATQRQKKSSSRSHVSIDNITVMRGSSSKSKNDKSRNGDSSSKNSSTAAKATLPPRQAFLAEKRRLKVLSRNFAAALLGATATASPSACLCDTPSPSLMLPTMVADDDKIVDCQQETAGTSPAQKQQHRLSPQVDQVPVPEPSKESQSSKAISEVARELEVVDGESVDKNESPSSVARPSSKKTSDDVSPQEAGEGRPSSDNELAQRTEYIPVSPREDAPVVECDSVGRKDLPAVAEAIDSNPASSSHAQQWSQTLMQETASDLQSGAANKPIPQPHSGGRDLVRPVATLLMESTPAQLPQPPCSSSMLSMPMCDSSSMVMSLEPSASVDCRRQASELLKLVQQQIDEIQQQPKQGDSDEKIAAAATTSDSEVFPPELEND